MGFSMKSKFTLFTALGLILLSSTLFSQTITQTQTFTGVPNYLQNYTFNQFNPALGTLTNVEITLEIGTSGGSAIIDNDGVSAASGNADFGSTGSISSTTLTGAALLNGSLNPVVGNVEALTTQAFNLTADDGDAEAGGTANFSSVGTDAVTISGSSVTTSNSGNVNSSGLSQYEGTGTYNLRVTVNTTLDYVVGGGAQTQTSPPTAQNTLTVVYTYTPASTDLSLTKSVSTPNPNLNTNVTYFITLTNSDVEGDAATGLLVEDVLPVGVTFVSYTASQGTYDDGTGIWDLGSYVLTSGSSETLNIVVAASSTGIIDNIAQINAVDQTDPDSTPDNDVGGEDDQDNATIVVTAPDADLRLEKTVDNATPNLGDAVVYTITITNDGPDGATNVDVTDVLPSGVSYTSSTPSQGSYSSGTGIWDVGGLSNGASATLAINATVTGTGIIDNIAQVTATDQNDADSTPNNNVPAEDDQDNAVITVPEVADLSLTKVVDNNTPIVGGSITYTVTLTNDGPDDADNVVVHDLISGVVLTYQSHVASQGTYSDATGDWSVGTLASGNSVTLDITVLFNGGTHTNVAEVTACDQGDPDSTPNNGLLSEDDQDEVLITDQNADLEITKTVSNSLPSDGDNITFTIVVTNNGPNAANTIEITDLLGSGLLYSSHTATTGTYTAGTGIWAIPTLSNGASATLTITVTVSLGTCASIDLGPAVGYNVFLFDDITQPSADTQGKMAVGGDAYLSAYSVGDKLPASNGAVDVLIVDGNLLYISGDVWGGNVVYGNSSNLPTNTVSVRDGTVRQDNPIDFTSAYTYLSNLSNTLSGYVQNGTVTNEWGTLTLTGTHPYLNVFNISGDDFSSANSRIIDVPSGSGVLVNIDGAFINVSRGLDVKGTGINNVLFNFYQATQINIYAVDVTGTVLAPDADVVYNSGIVTGQLIANSMNGSGQFNHSLFTGDIPCSSNLTNCATITGSDKVDLINTNDQSCASVSVVSDAVASGDWTKLGTFPDNEIIYSLSSDNSGNILAGTVGGRLFKSSDGGVNWSQINGNLPAGFIWTIKVNTAGDIYLGTEAGIFYSTDGGVTWISPALTINYIRSIEINDVNGDMYAGTWGAGMYKSTDNGVTWTQFNSGLGSGTVVTSVAADIFGNIYAGTFGKGVFKSTDDGVTWIDTDLGYDYVWDISVTSAGNVYVATYGGGIYRSLNNGTTWEDLNSLLDLWYTYAVAIDATDNVFISTWTGGIYKLTGITPSAPGGSSSIQSFVWEPVGMNGFGVSSLLIDENTNTIFAGIDDGTLYGNSEILTSVDSNIEVPVEFDLGQNYPNPFNPTTSIKVSIQERGNYSLRIYNSIGQEVNSLFTGSLEAGYYDFTFDGKNLSSGVYFYSLTGKNINITKKMMLLK